MEPIDLYELFHLVLRRETDIDKIYSQLQPKTKLLVEDKNGVERCEALVKKKEIHSALFLLGKW